MWNPVKFKALGRCRIGFRPIIPYNTIPSTTLLPSRGLTIVANLPKFGLKGAVKVDFGNLSHRRFC